MLGRYDEALVLRQQLTSAEPENARRYFDASLVQLHARRFAQARAGFTRALALAADYDEARAMLARTDKAEAMAGGGRRSGGRRDAPRWLARLGAREEAQAAYVALAARDDASADGVVEAAKYALDRGDLEVAELLAPRAIARGPAPNVLIKRKRPSSSEKVLGSENFGQSRLSSQF